MSQSSIKKGTLYILYIIWTHPSPGLEKCSATCFSQLEILDFKRSPNVSNWFAPGRTRPRKTSSTRSFQIVPSDILLNGLLWLWLEIEMISKMIKGQSKDMQLQFLCEWRQPSGFTRKVPGKDFSDPKNYWYHLYMDVMDVLKIIPKFHSCFFLHYSTKRSTCFINPQDTLTSHHTALLQREGPLLPQYGHLHSNKMMTIQVYRMIVQFHLIVYLGLGAVGLESDLIRDDYLASSQFPTQN